MAVRFSGGDGSSKWRAASSRFLGLSPGFMSKLLFLQDISGVFLVRRGCPGFTFG